MQRDRVLVAEMIGAVERIVDLVGDRSAEQILADPLRRETLMWNFTVLGEAASQVSGELKGEHVGIEWSDPSVCAIASSTATGRSTSKSW